MAYFDLGETEIVEVGIDAQTIGEAQHLEATAIDLDAEHYADKLGIVAHTAGTLVLGTELLKVS